MELHSVKIVANALHEAKVRYIVVEGLAVNVHGYERFTNDLDLVISLERENICKGLHALISIGYQPSIPIIPEDFANPENRARWHEEKSMLVLKLWSDIHRRTPIDVFIQEPFDFEAEWNQVVWKVFDTSEKLPVLAYESLIAMKNEAGRDKDLMDIRSLRKLDPYRP